MTTQHQTAPARRWAGLIVLILVALVAVVLPGTMSRSIPGVAGRGPVPRMPTVGDCLLRPVGPPDSAADGELIYPPVSTGPCSGPRFGEVVAVVASPKVQPPIVSPIDGSVADPSATACDDDVAGFLGTAAAVAPAQRSAVTWVVLPASVRSLRVEPSDLQKSVGQRWIACVGYLDPESVGQASADDYLRSAKGTFQLGSPPAAFATCVTSLVAGAMNHGDCFQPHGAESFGLAFGPTDASGLLLRTTCRALVTRYTGLTDPTAGGRLAVLVVANQNNKTVGDGVVDISTNGATCLVRPTAGRQLSGPLMGLGDKPVPLR